MDTTKQAPLEKAPEIKQEPRPKVASTDPKPPRELAERYPDFVRGDIDPPVKK